MRRPDSYLSFLIELFSYFWLNWGFVATCRLSVVAASVGYCLAGVPRLFIVVASVVAERGL